MRVLRSGHIAPDSNATASQALFEFCAETLSSTRPADVAHILNDNPLLLYTISSTHLIDSDAVKVENTKSVGRPSLGPRRLGY